MNGAAKAATTFSTGARFRSRSIEINVRLAGSRQTKAAARVTSRGGPSNHKLAGTATSAQTDSVTAARTTRRYMTYCPPGFSGGSLDEALLRFAAMTRMLKQLKMPSPKPASVPQGFQ